jgi:hypothetical protein
MRAIRQTVAINLKPMPQARLHHSTSAFDLGQESLDINMKVFVHITDMNRENGSEEQPAKARRRIHWQIHVPQRNSARRGYWARVKDL